MPGVARKVGHDRLDAGRAQGGGLLCISRQRRHLQAPRQRLPGNFAADIPAAENHEALSCKISVGFRVHACSTDTYAQRPSNPRGRV